VITRTALSAGLSPLSPILSDDELMLFFQR
jgi:hypothetical protein